MFKINDNYLKLPGSYLFSTIAKSCSLHRGKSDAKIIRLGIGDVTQPIAPAIIEKLHGAVDEMGHAETFPRICTRSWICFPSRYHCKKMIIGTEDAISHLMKFCIGRRKMRLQQHSGDLQPGQQDRCMRPGLSGLCRLQRNGRPCR